PDWHAAPQGLLARADAAAQHHVADAQLDEADGVRDDAAVVLVIRVDHHYDVSPPGEGFAVAGLLVAAVASVLGVDDHRQSHRAGYLDGAVLAAVINEDHLIHRAGRDVGQCGGQSPLGVVGRHDGDHALRPLRQTLPVWLGDQLHVKTLGLQLDALPI